MGDLLYKKIEIPSVEGLTASAVDWFVPAAFVASNA
jgi:hypothetical protein